ncbi:MAG: enterotoxin A family protein [Aeromonadaceae bacterium]
MLKFLLFLSFFVASTLASANEVRLYRGDPRSPVEIKAAGGFKPWGETNYNHPQSEGLDLSLFNHAQSGHPSTAYVSTSTSVESALDFAGYSSGFVYVIRGGAPNIFDIDLALGNYSPYRESEFSALGGIPWTQVIGWYVVRSGRITGDLIRNEDYNGRLYRRLVSPSPSDHYRMAGFPPGHAAWRQHPWVGFAPPECGGGGARNNLLPSNSDLCLEAFTDSAEKVLRDVMELIESPPDVLYRRDKRHPELIFSNGFSPKGIKVDLVSHIGGKGLVDSSSSMVSLSSSLRDSTKNPFDRSDFWVYYITPQSSAYSVKYSLSEFIENNESADYVNYVRRLLKAFEWQDEWVNLGAIPGYDIQSAERFSYVNGRFISVEHKKNDLYMSSYPSANPSPLPLVNPPGGVVNGIKVDKKWHSLSLTSCWGVSEGQCESELVKSAVTKGILSANGDIIPPQILIYDEL